MGEVHLLHGALARSAIGVSQGLASAASPGSPGLVQMQAGLASIQPSLSVGLAGLNSLSSPSAEMPPELPAVLPAVASVAAGLPILIADVRRKLDAVFALNFVVTAVVTGIVILAAGAVLISVFVRGVELSVLLTVISTVLADILFAYAYKPLARLQNALVATALLEAAHIRLNHELDECRLHHTPSERIDCSQKVWERLLNELRKVM